MTLVMHSLEENTDAAHKTRQADSWTHSLCQTPIWKAALSDSPSSREMKINEDEWQANIIAIHSCPSSNCMKINLLCRCMPVLAVTTLASKVMVQCWWCNLALRSEDVHQCLFVSDFDWQLEQKEKFNWGHDMIILLASVVPAIFFYQLFFLLSIFGGILCF